MKLKSAKLNLERLEERDSPSVVMQPDMARLTAARPRWVSVYEQMIGPNTQYADVYADHLAYLKQWYTPVVQPKSWPAPFTPPMLSSVAPATELVPSLATDTARFAASPLDVQVLDVQALDFLMTLPGHRWATPAV